MVCKRSLVILGSEPSVILNENIYGLFRGFTDHKIKIKVEQRVWVKFHGSKKNETIKNLANFTTIFEFVLIHRYG